MVLILMTARSGSSLVAKIFAAHGFDPGPERVFSHGYETFENAAVWRWIDGYKQRMPLPASSNRAKRAACSAGSLTSVS